MVHGTRLTTFLSLFIVLGRFVIVRGIAPRQKLMVCDEPVSALDVSTQRHICDRIAVMYKGEIVETGTKDDILSNPEHDYTKHLLSSEL